MSAFRHADIFKWRGEWWVEVRTFYTGWTDVRAAAFEQWSDAVKWAVQMVGTG